MERRNYAWPVTAMDREDYDAWMQWFDTHEAILRTGQLAIWGSGIRGTAFSILLKEKQFSNVVFVDSNSEKWGGCIDEFEIISPEQLDRERDTKKRSILISVENSAAIERDLDARGYRAGKDYFTVQTDQYKAYTQEFLRPCRQAALVMGDCAFSTISLLDSDHESLREKLYQRLGRDSIKVLAMHGIGLRAQYYIYRAQIRLGMSPKLLLIQVNFDTLTGKQHLLPRSQHTQLLELLLEAQQNPSREFIEYVQLTRERSQNLKMEFFTGGEEIGVISESKARNYLRLNYLYDLDVQTEGLVYLARLLDEAYAEGLAVMPFIPPVNYQLADRLFGAAFERQYQRNTRKIRELVEGKGFPLLDFSYSLTSDQFSAPITPSETANSRGRNKIADILCRAVREIDNHGAGNS